MDTIKLPRVMIPESKIRQRVMEIGHEITKDLKGKEVIAVCVLKGAYMFYADLIRAIDLPLHCEFIGVSSYGNKTSSSGEVKITLDTNEPMTGKHVILVEDIVDSGLTMEYLVNHFKTRKPASLRVCTLLHKPEATKTEVTIDYVGFKIANEFVVGYGLDYMGRYRQVPYIGVMDNES